MSFSGLTCLFCLLFLFSEGSFAWSGRGHAFIAESSIQNLDEKTKKALVDVLKVGPWNHKKRYASLESLVAQASRWPDWIKDKKVKELFKRSGSGVVPTALKGYENSTTQNWHYVNVLFFTDHGDVLDSTTHLKSGSCLLKNTGELFSVWPLLIEAYQQSLDRRDKALLLAFILHLGADAYQPLHVLSALDKECMHDAGGNRYCVKPSGKKCRQNLHQLWDEGFGFFDKPLIMARQTHPNTDVKSLQHVLIKHKPYLESVYPKSPGVALRADYEHQALQAVTQLSVDSVAYLALMLTYLEP